MNARFVLLLLLVGPALGCATIGPGKVGVLWKSSGGTQDQVYGEGREGVWWGNEMYVYDTRVMSHDEVLTVIAVNGLTLKLDASVRYRLVPSEVVALHKEIGPEYYPKIIEPVLRSEARRVIGQYTPEEIYSTKRDVIERQIREGTRAKIEGHHLALEAVLIRNVELPDAIRAAIDQKLAAEQEVLKMRYVLEVTKARAEQQRIEAQGISDYNRIVTASLSPQVLEFEQIQQLGKLAESQNSKTVVLGPGAGNQALLMNSGGVGTVVPPARHRATPTSTIAPAPVQAPTADTGERARDVQGNPGGS
ncbi:MAG TPA: prohibitin family protein [Myxococcaceae bacterium]|nr:prohibitin family protein [Myxococcaceae bacterium]